VTFALAAVGLTVAIPVAVVCNRIIRARNAAAKRKQAQERKRALILRRLHERPAPDVTTDWWLNQVERRKTPRPPLPQVDDDNNPEPV
jgi:hypothetical protein